MVSHWDLVLEGVVRNIEEYDCRKHGAGKFAVLTLTGPIAMSNILLPHLHTWPHLRRTDSELGLLYDLLGQHERKQGHFGAGTHYSKLRTPIVLR